MLALFNEVELQLVFVIDLREKTLHFGEQARRYNSILVNIHALLNLLNLALRALSKDTVNFDGVDFLAWVSGALASLRGQNKVLGDGDLDIVYANLDVLHLLKLIMGYRVSFSLVSTESAPVEL